MFDPDSLAAVPDGPAENKGVALGRSVAEHLLELRAADQSGIFVRLEIAHADDDRIRIVRGRDGGDPRGEGFYEKLVDLNLETTHSRMFVVARAAAVHGVPYTLVTGFNAADQYL